MADLKQYTFEHPFEQKDTVFYNIKDDPFEVFGICDYKNDTIYRRIPDDIAKATNEGVYTHARQSAGGRIRFSTDSPYLIIRAEIESYNKFNHMPLTSVAGMDVYIDGEWGSFFHKVVKAPYNFQNEYTEFVNFGSQKIRNLTINMPLFAVVKEIYIGVAPGSKIEKGKAYINTSPVVFYGSSITNGACCSRPGLCYENFISRKLNLDYKNLGFSGSAKGEDSIVNYMASLDMLVFVCDYDHNAPTAEHLKNTHFKLYEAIRANHPTLPYVMITRPDAFGKETVAYRTREVIYESYKKARALGDENVYFIDGESFFSGPDVDSCTVDTTHPNDIGFSKMADKIGTVLQKIINGLMIGENVK